MEQISTFQTIMAGFDFSPLLDVLLGVIPALICITIHELSHGLVAWLLGDNTAKNMGRLSLNPIKHLDIMGLLMLVVFHMGWAKPVPINMNNFKNPKRGMAVSALAGPVSNFLIAVVFMFLFGLLYFPLYDSPVGGYVLEMLQLTAYISIGLGIFNLIPVPPLDGSKVLLSFLSDEGYEKLMRYERYGMLILVVLVATGVLGTPLSKAINAVYARLVPIAQGGLNTAIYLFYK